MTEPIASAPPPASADPAVRAALLVGTLCLAEILGMASFSCFPALLPTFLNAWRLSNTEAGWINSMFFAGYLAAVPVLVGLTDRVDARRIYLACTALAAVASAAFAFLADGLWSAMLWRTLAGVALAGTYMPGLKALSDWIGPRYLSRAVAFYTASFGIASSLSFYLSGVIERSLDWRWAFGLAAVGPLLAFPIVYFRLPARPVQAKAAAPPLSGFGRVLRNRRVMGYVLSYTFHNWELFAWRSWIVAFLTFSWKAQPSGTGPLTPATLAAIVNLMGLPASVLGNEVAAKLGRRRHIVTVMALSTVIGTTLGFLAEQPAWLVIAVALLYGAAVMGDSAATTSGTVAEADPALRGTTMAVHSCVGFTGSFLGPLVVGLVLDATGGGATRMSWGAAFIATAGASAVGATLLLTLTRGQGMGGRAA